MPKTACPMVLQEFAQISQGRQELQSLMHELQDHHDAVTEELASERLQHANTRQQLSAVKVRLFVYDLVAYTVPHKTGLTVM